MDTFLGWLGVVILFYPWWSPRCRRRRKELAAGSHVSGNTRSVRPSRDATVAYAPTTGTGPLWEQDAVWAEVFEDDEIGDDL